MLSRENFRINNSGMSNFGSSLILYDEIIFSLIQRFIAHIEIILNTKELRKELNGVENLETHLATLKLQRDNIIKILDK
ncbi:hypothetical protein [Methanobacterium spitsbergense]|uniref:Uncharacterized protein n=1 Tax=Methanobacterium spitsbergense TaxID=2874285 RepID=A0A8T5UNL5_9EURY|nr:hypothetical protein [Methanobacterium spitsbergense]MBZ2165408.1 hypothetical protein [Methanobacterium spitsbergense]